MTRSLLSRLALVSLLSAACAGAALALPGDQSSREKDAQREAEKDAKKLEKEKAKRLEKLDREDREALSAPRGFVAPEFTSGINWVGDSGAPSMKSLRGKVVVIQTFNLKNNSAKGMPEKVAKALADFKPDDVQIIAIHSPEGADKAEEALKARTDMLVGIDRDGAFHDLIGAYKKPVNVVVDRVGNVREAGLTMDGLVDYVTEFVAEPRDSGQKPTERPSATSEARKDFPTFPGGVRNAIDMRGKAAPRLPNVQWMWNRRPDTTNRLLIIDFWATWCGPCRQAIPHMNEIAKKYGRDVACAGVSDEAPNTFEKGLRQYGLNPTSFEYCIGTDPTSSMKKAFGISGIPHIAVISSDNIVRWQGHPDGLTMGVVQQLVDANRSLVTVNDGGSVGDRWKRDMEAEKDRGGSRERKKGY